jgi:hypothetical protein
MCCCCFRLPANHPRPDRFASEIPEIEKRGARLDAKLRLWIILDEYNQDTIGQSFYLEPEPPLGRFSKAFFLPFYERIHCPPCNQSRREPPALKIDGS